MVLQAKTNTWSNQRRKRRQHSKYDPAGESVTMETNDGKNSDNVKANSETDSDKPNAQPKDQEVANEQNTTSTGKSRKSLNGKVNNDNVQVDKSGIDERGDKDVEFCSSDSKQSTGQKRGLDKTETDNDSKRIKVVDKCETGTMKTSEEVMVEQTIQESTNSDNAAPVMPSRRKIQEQFLKEMEANTKDKKKKQSFYESLEPFSKTDECLVLCKMVLRKDEGKMSLTINHEAGNKEAMHQIMQYFRNLLTKKVDSPQPK